MKYLRNIVVFTTLFTILFTSYKLKANAFAIDPSSIAALGDLGYGLFAGAKFNFDNTKYVVDPSEVEDITKVTEKVQEFIEDYAAARFNIIGNTDYSYRSLNFDKNVRTIWNNYSLADNTQDQDASLMFELSQPSISSWMHNDIFWYRYYANSFRNDEIIIPDLPNQYSYLVNQDKIYYGADDFLNSSLPFISLDGSAYRISLLFNRSDVSYYNANGINHNYGLGNSVFSLSPTQQIITIHVNSSTNTVSYENMDFRNTLFYYDDYGWTAGGNTINFMRITDVYQFYGYTGNAWDLKNPSTNNLQPSTQFNSLDDAIQYIYNHFSNFNLEVDGTYWLYINTTGSLPVIPEFPDIIHPDTGEPAYDIVIPNNSTGEGYFDLTSLLDKITQAIIGASDTDDSTNGILEKDGVRVVDTDKETDIDTTDVPAIEVVTDDALQGDSNLPVIPLPPEIKDAFNGTSILAELIDGTQKVLPAELINVFWGIICVIFIIGLIRVMHK